MRLIRTIHRPFKTNLFHQLQHCQVNKSLSVRPRPELIEASDLGNGSNILCHGRSYAASASADAMEARKSRRRVSKNERKSMVENYVKKYRETNGGKFPTASDAMNDVGGNYYAVRAILQELIHNSKQPSVDTEETSMEKSAAREDGISSDIEVVSKTTELGEVIGPVSKEDIGNHSSNVFESNQGKQSSVSVETGKSIDVGTQSDHLIGKTESTQHRDPENNVKRQKLENKLNFDGLEPKTALRESTETSRSERQKVGGEDAEPQEKPSMWNNLKSLASGILSLWKRS